MVCDPRSCAHPKSQRCTAYTGMSRISWASSRAARPASRRSVRSGQRIAGRRCALRRAGEGVLRRALGSCSLTRRFREAAPYGVTHGAVPT